MGKHCEAVELLLARMDSNPEEFTENGRWEGLIIKYRSYLPVQDRTAMEDKINYLRLDVFHKDVMKELLVEPSEDAVVDPSFYQGTRPGTQVINTVASTYEALRDASAYQNASANRSNQSIKDIAAALSTYASNSWKP